MRGGNEAAKDCISSDHEMMEWIVGLDNKAEDDEAVSPRPNMDTTTHLVGESTGSKVLKRQLESSICALIVDLESHRSLWIGDGSGGHDCYD